MPTGPWLTPPAQSITVDETVDPLTPYSFSVAQGFTDFAEACETTSPSTGTQNSPDRVPSSLWVVVNPDGTTFWEIRHRPLVFDAVNFVNTHVTNYMPTLPPAAVGFEYETPTPTLSQKIGWLNTAAASWTVYANQHLGGLAGETLTPAALTGELRAAAGSAEDFLTGTALAGLPLLWSHTFPASLDQTLSVGPVSINLAGLATTAVRTLWLTYAEQISHDGSALVPPTPSPAAERRMSGGTADLIDRSVGGPRVLHLDVTWTPSRYRFVYDRLPRLRQFPRDDALGGAPRQGKTNGATSVQESTRQGWRGAYR